MNYDATGAAPFAHSDMGALLDRLEPSTLRWPGGNEANYFDWRTGTTTRNPQLAPLTLADLESAHRATGATPIFDLNVLSAANRLDPTDQIDMLKTAQHLGLPVKYVEIGNELYGGGERATAFPNGTAYGKTVSVYVKALHAAFPGVQVAADGCLNPTGTREQQWNTEMLTAASGSGTPDAIILHDYPGAYENPFTTADVPSLFATLSTAIADLTTTTQRLDGKPVWLTEYNFRGPYSLSKHDTERYGPNPVQTSFAHELYLAAFAIMLPRVAHVTLADYWAAFNGKAFSAWTDPDHPTLTPGGQAVEMIDTAAHDASSSTPIAIPNIPTLPGGGPAVIGQAFHHPDHAVASVLVNLAAGTQSVPAGTDVPAGSAYQQVTGNPITQLTVAPTPHTGTVPAAGLQLPPYSLTVTTPGATS